MNDQNSDCDKPFSYDILDQEAAKISEIVLQVQQKCAELGDHVALDLFNWAEKCTDTGKRTEAEFLYLNVITLWERRFGVTYPIYFTSLRDYCLCLLEKYQSAKAPTTEPRSIAPNPVPQSFEAAA